MDSRVSADSAAAAETKEWARTIAIDKVSAMTESCCQLISKRMRQAWEPGRFARAHRKNFEMPYARAKSRRELPWWWWKLLRRPGGWIRILVGRSYCGGFGAGSGQERTGKIRESPRERTVPFLN